MGTLNNGCRIIIGTQKGALILTTTHVSVHLVCWLGVPTQCRIRTRSRRSAAVNDCLAPVAMSCLSSTPTFLAVPDLKHADHRNDAASTVAGEHSDIETVTDSCPSAVPSPCSSGTVDLWDDADGPCNVVVRSTFIDVDDGRSLRQRFKHLRGAMTDSLLKGAFADEEPYYPGRFSDERAEAQKAANVPSAPAAPAEPAPQPTPPRAEASMDQDGKPTTTERTTLLLRNVPNNYSRDMFLAMLDEAGFAGRYDFVYLPRDFQRKANLGYAFVNLVDGAAVDALWQTFDGFSGWTLPTAKVCQVSWSGLHQGFKAGDTISYHSIVWHSTLYYTIVQYSKVCFVSATYLGPQQSGQELSKVSATSGWKGNKGRVQVASVDGL